MKSAHALMALVTLITALILAPPAILLYSNGGSITMLVVSLILATSSAMHYMAACYDY